MTRVQRLAAVASAAALALPLAACGGSGGDYCDVVSDAQNRLAGLDFDDPTNTDLMTDMADAFQDIANAAPDDIKGDWETMNQAVEALSDIDFSDMEALVELEETFGNIDQVNENIAQHVLDECDIDIN